VVAAGSVLRRAALAAFIVLGIAAPVQAGEDDFERIIDFVSDSTVRPDGTIAVRETITVNVLGDFITHGIKRDFPTKLPNGGIAGFDVASVTRDGRPEPYSVGLVPGGKEVKIGDAGVDLPHGHHTYVIAYTTDRQIRSFPEYDEFYWNATGNDWMFEIYRAEAVIHLPPNAHIRQSAFYTGKTGERGRDATMEMPDAHTLRVITTRRFYDREGLTVAVGFDKGVVAPPSSGDRIRYFMRDHVAITIVLSGALVLLLYYLVAWALVGRDPRGGTVIPLFAAPDGMSAAAVRYLVKGGFDDKVFAAALVSLAVRRVIRITQARDKTYTLIETGEGEDVDAIESRMMVALFRRDSSIELKQANHSAVAMAVAVLTSHLSATYDSYRIANWRWFWPGLVIFALTLLVLIVHPDVPIEMLAVIGWSIPPLFGAAVFAFLDLSIWRLVFTSGEHRIGRLVAAIVLVLPWAGFLAMVVGILFFTFDISQVAIALLLVPVGLICLFHRLLKRPTEKAAKLLAQIKGLKLFLTTAEAGRLKTLNAPEVTPAVFEKFLPYAIALDCEDAWSKRFEAAAAAAGMSATEARGYEPSWYGGEDLSHLGAAAFAASLGSSLASAAASASFTPSSGSSGSSFSSGSSGGGFSGGGGGGGGGSGW